jgi:sugar O-acyltransferase (sialic acid O-acetyltransferase NeuD family)
MILSEILVPLLNANEPEARVVAIHVSEGQKVDQGALLLTIETTKAATDLEAPEAGCVRLLVETDQSRQVGERLAVITSTPDEPVELKSDEQKSAATGSLRMTRPARTLMETLGIDPGLLPADRLVTEEIVREIASLTNPAPIELPAAEKPYVLVFGGGGHAKAVIDLLLSLDQYTLAGILDDRLSPGTRVLGVPVLGTRALLPILKERGVPMAVNAVGGILDINIRVRIFELLAAAGYEVPSILHPRVTLERSAVVEPGVQVFANAYVGSEAILHEKCMINTGAVVSHDCSIGTYTHIAPGALLAGHVHVGDRSLVGMGVTTAVGVRIGSGVRIGNAAIVLADVPDRTIIQAGRFWTGKADPAR